MISAIGGNTRRGKIFEDSVHRFITTTCQSSGSSANPRCADLKRALSLAGKSQPNLAACVNSRTAYPIQWKFGGPRRYFATSRSDILCNEQITFPTIRVIDEDGNFLGEFDRDEALSIAKKRRIDLVLTNARYRWYHR